MVNVEIYVKIPEGTTSTTSSLTADSGLYTVDDTSITADATSVTESADGYTYKRLDLFKDEKISLTSSIQNINDLSKVFTDYSQSFTIPASKANNQIFNYWNESGVNEGFDQRIRYDAIIEINTIPFKKGQIQIEKANEKNNRVESFSVTFYGKVKQIKDLFKEDKLNVLDFTSLDHSYSYTEVVNRITGTTVDDVSYPLVGNKNKYEYLTGGTNDVTVGGSVEKSINYIDLFPAVPVSKVFDFIETKYGITFTSTLFSTSYWSDLYLYCKNTEQAKFYSQRVRVPFTTNTGVSFSQVNQSDNTINFQSFSSFYIQIKLGLTVSNTTVPYRVIVKNLNGDTIRVFDNLIGNQTLNPLDFSTGITVATTPQGGSFNGYIEIDSTAPLTFTTNLYIRRSRLSTSEVYIGYYAGSVSTTLNTNISLLVPDIKISDFFTGIIKMFNLTITATTETEFNLEPLEFYYAYGNYLDINSYVINDSVDLERTKLFKKLSFSHEKSENILNNYFRNAFQRGYDYGDLIYEDNLSNESSNYEIKSPFENVMWERSTTGNFQTTTLIDKDLKPYKPKSILMYKNNLQSLSTSVKLFDGSSYNNVTDYVRFSNELFLNNDIASLNFGEEQSSWSLSNLASDSLFALWYQNYISGLYDIRCRIVKLKAIMPITQLSNIKLNDKIVYKDKKYIINQFTTDLTTGEVDFELVSDFREITNSTGGTDRFSLKNNFIIDGTAQDLEVTILKLNSEKYDVQYDPTAFSARYNVIDDTFIVPIDANTTGDVVYKQIEITYYNPNVTQYINITQYV